MVTLAVAKHIFSICVLDYISCCQIGLYCVTYLFILCSVRWLLLSPMFLWCSLFNRQLPSMFLSCLWMHHWLLQITRFCVLFLVSFGFCHEYVLVLYSLVQWDYIYVFFWHSRVITLVKINGIQIPITQIGWNAPMSKHCYTEVKWSARSFNILKYKVWALLTFSWITE